MKSSTHHSFLGRRALVAASLSVLLGSGAAFAQSGGAGSTNYGTGAKSSAGGGTTSTTGSNASDDAQRNAQSSAIDPSTTSPSSSAATNTATTTQPATLDTAGGATTMTGRDNKLGWMERRFVNKVADSGHTEIGLAKLATERASNPEVKSFAQRLVDDHTKVSEELKMLASQKNVKIDEEDLGSDRAHKRLAKKSGTDFDQEFVEHMIDSHEASVRMFEKASQDAKDTDLRSFAAKHVDHLRQHLQQAQSLRSTIVPTGRIEERSSTSTETTGAKLDTTSTGASSNDIPRPENRP